MGRSRGSKGNRPTAKQRKLLLAVEGAGRALTLQEACVLASVNPNWGSGNTPMDALVRRGYIQEEGGMLFVLTREGARYLKRWRSNTKAGPKSGTSTPAKDVNPDEHGIEG